MKLILSLMLIWALCSSAGALQCQTCSDVLCSSSAPRTCPSETMCVTAATEETSPGVKEQIISKSCASSSDCPATGVRTVSQSFGGFTAVTSAKCCSTDNCNSETLPFPPAPSTNSLQCFTCNSDNSECDTKLQCRGEEDRCFQMRGTSENGFTPMFGCMSANLCPTFTENNGSCCATSLCNNATTSAVPKTTTTSTQSPKTTTTTTTAVPKTTTTSTQSPKTTSDASCCRLSVLHLLGLLVFTLD